MMFAGNLQRVKPELFQLKIVIERVSHRKYRKLLLGTRFDYPFWLL